MKKSKWLSHPILTAFLALYCGIFLNVSVVLRRFGEDAGVFVPKLQASSIELLVVILGTFGLFRVLSLGGYWFYRVTATLVVLISIIVSYYMTFFKIVVGYGVVISALNTSDIDLFSEVVGRRLIIWVILVSVIPLGLIWLADRQNTLLKQLVTPQQRLQPLIVLVGAMMLIWGSIHWMSEKQKMYERTQTLDLPSYGGVVAHSYLPINWIAALGLHAYTEINEWANKKRLFNPVDKYTYEASPEIDDIYLIFIIGETARWDHLGLLGYQRDTTPLLSLEPNLVAFRGYSCDTSTKLSLRCMFVREGGAEDNPQRTLKEQNVFSVLHALGFSSELFSMQSEVWFYKQTQADNFAFRELIASEQRNYGKAVDDMLLVDEVADSISRYPKGKHLIILHTKGSHYLYSRRYPRHFAKYQPECMGVDEHCNKEVMINAYDNSILYTDYFIKNVIEQIRDKKALLFYTSDHGESISDDVHFHGTPREIAPPEQFSVPFLVWASDKFLTIQSNADAFAHLRQQAQQGIMRRHTELYDSLLGCLGYRSPNGGIVAKNNWCHL